MAHTPRVGGDRQEYCGAAAQLEGAAVAAQHMCIEEYLSEETLRELTGQEDLDCVRKVEVIIDLTENSIGVLGRRLPNLQELKLNGSVIPSLRDLGTSLFNVCILWVSRCGLRELDGISGFPSLRELYASYNSVEDISPLAVSEFLEVVDLEGNCVDSLDQVEFLASCPHLISLNLDGNPCVGGPDTRQRVSRMLPSLQVLDDVPLRQSDQGPDHAPVDLLDSLDAQLDHERGALAEFLRDEKDMVFSGIKHARVGIDAVPVGATMLLPSPSGGGRPATAGSVRDAMSGTLRPFSARASSAPRVAPQSMGPPAPPPPRPPSHGSGGGRTTTFGVRPQTAQGLSTNPRASRFVGRGGSMDKTGVVTADDEEDSSSQLTYGNKDVICGNPIKSLRSRQQRASMSSSSMDMMAVDGAETVDTVEEPGVKSPSPVQASSDSWRLGSRQTSQSTFTKETLLEELRAWKLETADLVLESEDDLPMLSQEEVEAFMQEQKRKRRSGRGTQSVRNIRKEMLLEKHLREEKALEEGGADVEEEILFSETASEGKGASQGRANVENQPPSKGGGTPATADNLLPKSALSVEGTGDAPVVVGRLRPRARDLVRRGASGMPSHGSDL